MAGNFFLLHSSPPQARNATLEASFVLLSPDASWSWICARKECGLQKSSPARLPEKGAHPDPQRGEKTS